MKSSGIGGQAVLEGIMMRHQKDIAVAVRKPDGEIVVGEMQTMVLKEKYPVCGWPVIRGIVSFIFSLVIGIKTLMFSADFFAEDEPSGKKEKDNEEKPSEPPKAAQKIRMDSDDKREGNISPGMMVGTIVFSLAIALVAFMIVPYYASVGIMKLIGSDSATLLAVFEGIIKLAIFIGYVAVISLMKDIRRTFMYHGSEHKCINCIESGKELTVDNVMASSKEHRRCGTSFVFFVLFISIIFFIFLRFDNMALRFIARLLLIPVIAGLSYEFIQWAGNSDTKLAAVLSRPGMWVQALTTKEPTPDMVEVAICAVEAVFDWRAYLKQNGVDVPGAEDIDADEKETCAEGGCCF